MDPATILLIVNGAVSIIQALAPQIQAAIQDGKISPEQQQTLLNALNAIRQPAAFSAPENKLSTES